MKYLSSQNQRKKSGCHVLRGEEKREVEELLLNGSRVTVLQDEKGLGTCCASVCI
jgi:hypothetical protein